MTLMKVLLYIVQTNSDLFSGALSGTISKEAKEIIDSSDDLFESWAKLLFATPLWKYYDTADVKASINCIFGFVSLCSLFINWVNCRSC